MTTIIIVSGTSQTSPADWNNSNNSIQGIGGGGGGCNGSAGYGAGGGEYRKITNFSVATPGTTAFNYVIGGGGTGAATSVDGGTGGNTTFNTSSLIAVGGGGGKATFAHGAGGTGGTGAAASNAGGNGGDGVGNGGAGGGGAGGPNGVGRAGGSSISAGNGGGGGGGTGTSGTVGSPGAATIGGAGGQGGAGTGSGGSGAANTNGGAATAASGAGGGGAGAGGTGHVGGQGATGTEFDATHGPGGGGGGGSTSGSAGTGGAGALYGGGGGSGGAGTATGGNGANGIIWIIYTPAVGGTVPQGWQNLDNDIFPPRAISFTGNPALQSPPFTTTTTIAGIAWQGPRDHVKLPPKGAVSDAPAYGKPPFTVPGVAWTEPPDRDKLPVRVNQDSAPPAYGVFVPAVGVSGISWFEPPDRDKPSVKVSQDATPPAYGRFVPAVGISGNGWFLPLEIALPKAKVESNPPAFGQPTTTPVAISGIAWDTLHETDILPKGKYLTDPVAVPYAPQTSTWSFLVGDTTFIRDAPIDIPPTMGTTPTAAVTVPVSGIAWYTQTDQTKVRVSFDQPPAHVLRPFAAVNTNAGIPWFEPADVDKKPVRINGEAQPGFAFAPPPVRISGMAWYEPADRDRPVLKVSIESSPAFAVFAPAPPVGVSGMAWFAPKPDSVVVQVSFSQAPALQQPIVQLVPPPDDGTRGSETILTDRRGAGQFTRRQYDEFLKAKRAAEHKARLLKKKPGAELRKAVEVAEEAVAKAGLLGDIAPSIEPITDALFDAADANVAQVAAEAREAIRVAEALLLQMDEEREEEAVLMLLLGGS